MHCNRLSISCYHSPPKKNLRIIFAVSNFVGKKIVKINA